MNKNDLVNSVAAKSGLSKADAGKAVDAVIDSIIDGLKDGEEIRLVGFGTFKTIQTKAREGRNPQTGATIQIPAKRQPKFVAGKAVKDAVA